jgi:transcriptional regulator with XRE-family HTH domain
VLRLEQFENGTQIRLLRVAVGLTQHELAGRADVDRRRLSEFERNQAHALDVDAVNRVRAALVNANNVRGASDGMASRSAGNPLAKSVDRQAFRGLSSTAAPAADRAVKLAEHQPTLYSNCRARQSDER